MVSQAKIEFTPSVAAAASKAFFWRRLRTPFGLFFLLSIAFWVVAAVFWPRDNFGRYFVGGVVAVLLFSLSSFIGLYLGMQKRIARDFAGAAALPATLELLPDGFKLQLGDAVTPFQWSKFKHVWQGPGYFLLLPNFLTYIHVPTNGMPDEVRQAFVSRLTQQPAT